MGNTLVQAVVVFFGYEPDPVSTPVYSLVILFQDARAGGDFRRDFRHIHTIGCFLDGRLADCPTLLRPKLLYKFGAANLDQLQALQVCGFRQEDISEVIGLVIGIGERDRERELGYAFSYFRRIPR